jgi:hypothetical protein
LTKANEIWAPAHILFVSVVAEKDGVKGVPIIRDPDTHLDSWESVGDIDAGTFSIEHWMAAFECQKAWLALDYSLEGPIVVTVRKYGNIGFAEAFGVSSGPDFDLQVGNDREDDFCAEPRHITTEDVFDMDGISTEHADVGFATVAQPGEFASANHHGRVLAHELGHMLTLGHGNGLDDNGDGQPAGTTGSRRFDEYCDPLGKGEDASDEPCNSLMEDGAPCEPLTPLQIEQARAVAALMPGCSGECD